MLRCTITIDIKNIQKIKVDIDRLKRLANFIFQEEKTGKSGDYLSIILVDDKKIKEINKKYHYINQTTDVLAFNLSEKGIFIGDIVISVETGNRKAKELNVSLENELFLYLTHGILHLLEYNDNSEKEYKLMKKREEEILRNFQVSISNFY